MMEKSKQYDAIIIGAGIGGLFCANYLALRKKRVLVVEQHRTPGGYICGFKRGNYYFDGANNSFSSHGCIFSLLKEIGMDKKIKFYKHEMTQIVESVDLHFHYDSFESFSDAIKKAFKTEEKIDEFLKIIKDFYDFFEIVERYQNPLLFSGLHKVLCTLKYGKILFMKSARSYIKSVLKYGRLSSKQLVKKFFAEGSEAYKFFINYGNPNQNAIVLGAMISEFIKDKWYPEGGEQNFANLLAQNAIEHGAEFRYSTYAEKIITESNHAVGIVTNQGAFKGKKIIFASDYKKAFLTLCDNKNLLKESFLKQLKKAQVSESLFTIYLGLKCDAKDIEERLQGNRMNYSLDITPKDTTKLTNDPDYFKNVTISIFSPSVASKGITPEGYSSLTIQCLCPGRWMNNWGNGNKEEYKRLKNEVTKQLMDIFEAALPGLSEKIEYIEAATPRTYERYTLNTDGSYCAWSWEPHKSFFRDINIHVKTPIKNLYCCSDWCYKIGGMVSAMIASRRIAIKYVK